MLKIAIIGYGKMGHQVESVATERGHKIVLTIDNNNLNDLTTENLKMVDVAIEFTSPETAYKNVKKCFEAGIPVVCGTTGWNNQLEELIKVAQKGENTFFYASNFSIGVNIFFKITRYASALIERFGSYSPEIAEIHHTQKIDAPSGTAISIANILADELSNYNGWTLKPETSDEKIPIEAIREGTVPGTHIVNFNSEIDSITLKHEAKSRRGFALGAVMAAEFIHGQKGFFNMDDLLKLD
ncbi:MAG: 4-hydroxy-tetrahydrodipicolinate reductase [Tenuifilum sp.]|jgi:4-hydroxy-tetrahydrodipicolinate reductase|uniref:4-hydroxy-tetrahydrodipicolinate reductase n=1 Tax=Tenuifilum sp. TaxID=2760880 RepID=UPI0024AC79B9|nr:4-hydroxy-tetrahydrodipicolinate reductase [Tenuifilum sp.]MDI3527872.1 4-hydroxy-tetrahydrodipicolinate reductase [Tenuifilum sp.]